ncbi:MAG TPA: AAA family ATPase [Longimicrobiales bacterium]|nr:AAA family ATPase [Longimicrobiales bacterium]
MRLRSLTLYGFKSFADRTELHFHDGITAIVGPNGCGKSNISDAIRWVLGEQKPTAIRGSRMEEAIFQGTTQRRPLNRAEVALSFDNRDGRLPIPQKDVEIRRTVFREGGSDYQLNRTQTRLRDILDLCRDTGLGANAYTVIEQGMVDAILSDRADERRHLFEEAAGIGRYKDRRKSAQRRLEAAEADLARLLDLVGEVETKVRSLARQRGRAQRYAEFRARRLSLEVAVANAELEQVRQMLDETTARLEGIERDDPGARAELSAAEAELEKCRLESTELSRQRGVVAAEHEAVVRRIADRERDLAVAQERSAAADRRLVQIAAERDELDARLANRRAEVASLDTERSGQHGVVETLAGRVAEIQERNAALRREVTEVRRADEDARARETELTRELGTLEARADRAAARARESEALLERLGDEMAELRAEAQRLDEQGDLFAEQARQLAAKKADLEERKVAFESEVTALREAEQGSRVALASVEEESSRLGAQVGALEKLDRDFHGFAPAVAAALGSRGQLPGLVGPLADVLELPAERGAALEAALGSLLQMLVVESDDSMAAVRRWIDENQQDKGGVALLPRTALARLEAVIAEMQFAGERPDEPVLVGRRERLTAMREKADQALVRVDEMSRARADAANRVSEGESSLRALLGLLHEVELELRRTAADEDTRAGQRGRAARAIAELEKRRDEANASVGAARADGEEARAAHLGTEVALKEHRAAWQRATGSLPEREAAWEAVRDEEAEIRVSHARAEGSLTAIDRRMAVAKQDIEHAVARLEALADEERANRDTIEELAALRETAAAELETLFENRETSTAGVRSVEDRLAEAADRAIGLETKVRGLRRSTDEASEVRHRLELQRAEALSTERRVRDRLEAEWGRPFDQLAEEAEPVSADLEFLRADLSAVTADIERLGPINMLAMEEHEEESTRLEFLTAQRDDLVAARDDLQNAIRQINRTAKELFNTTFEQIRGKFTHTFDALFEGGECDIRLEDPDDPLETPIDITASPRGKRTQRIHLLSGGERALTSLALLFAIYLVKPSPFCVLDEVDAPLDDVNIGRFIAMLERFKADTQFIVITHNSRTMESADWLYGVTMEEPGISSIVGVHLDQVLAGAGVNGG